MTDVFLAKYAAETGQLVWLKRLGQRDTYESAVGFSFVWTKWIHHGGEALQLELGREAVFCSYMLRGWLLLRFIAVAFLLAPFPS